jgi:hypothetical protein
MAMGTIDNVTQFKQITGKPFKPVYIGQKIRFLTILEVFKRNKKWVCKCKCDCGNIKIIDKSSILLGKTQSCGCYNKKRVHETHSKGNFTKTRLYTTWENMKARCYNPNNPQFHNYGGRGIIVCEEWKDDFLKFRKWAISNGWDETHKKFEISLDRINVNGNYEPTNCRWVSYKIQVNNQRKSRRWLYDGVSYTLLELSEKFNINPMALRSRLYTQKLDVKTAIERPLQKRSKNG